TVISFSICCSLILFFGIGSILIIMCFSITYLIINKKDKNKIYKKTKNKKMSLKLKIHLNTLNRAKFEIFVLGIISFVATLILSTLSLLIGSLNKYISESNDLIKYKNMYQSNDSILNIPFSRKTVSA